MDDDLDWRVAYGGAFLTAVEIPQAGQTYRIREVWLGDVEDQKTKQPRTRLHVLLSDMRKPWLPCRTAAGSIAAMFGDKTGGWLDRAVTLYHDPTVKVGSKAVGGVRVMGSPELDKELRVDVDLGSRKPPAKVTLRPTGRGQGPASAPSPAPLPAPRPPTLEDLGLTRAGVDALLAERDKPPATDAALPAILARLAHPDSAAALARARELSRPATAADVPPLDQE